MEKGGELTRREALQGIAGVAVAALAPKGIMAEHANDSASMPWPADASASSEHVRPFNADWRFQRGDAAGAEGVGFDDATWRILDVPHDWSIEDRPEVDGNGEGAIWTAGTTPLRAGPFDMYLSEGQGSTGWTVGGVGWYRKTFEKPPMTPGGKAELLFEGVYMNCDVWLNGTHLGNHPYGYTEFAFDLTSHLHEGRNTLAVRVNNAGRNSRWYSGSGIYRKVWLLVTGELRIPIYGVSVSTPQVTSGEAEVDVQVTVESGAPEQKQTEVHVRLVDSGGAVAGETSVPVTVMPGERATVNGALTLKNPWLWSPAAPHLYRVEVALEANGKFADGASFPFGVRKVEIDAIQGLRVNGKNLKLHGGCVHHDNGPLGSACIPRAEERRVEILKANGFNAIRTSHNPPSPDFLDACDRLGMLVIDEAFDCWEMAKNPDDYHLYFEDWWQRDLESMILRDRNHACVILWSIANEVSERAEPRGVELGQSLSAYVHKLDSTRMVTAAICGPYDHPKQTWNDMQPAFTHLDVAGYNYEFSEYEKDHAQFPNRIIVGTESFPNQAFQNWQAIEKDGWVIGDFVWTAIDYLGESGIGHASIGTRPGPGEMPTSYPWFDSYCGDIDITGNKKPQSYYRDVVWRLSKVEMAVQRPVPQGWTEHVSGWGWSDELRSWTWPGFEEKPMRIRVYTRADQVKLLLNGKEVGSKALTDKHALTAEFVVPYSPGELKAVVYESGLEAGSTTYRTAGKARKLVLTPDRTKLKASGDDLSYAMLKVVDDGGNVIPDADALVSFAISGVGEIAAVASANPKDVASFRQPRRDTFHGMCLLVIRPVGKPGIIEVRAESRGLGYATVRLEVSR